MLESIPLLGWYVGLLKKAVQPRNASPEGRDAFWYGRAGEGWGSSLWFSTAAPLLVAGVGGLIVGLWWLPLVVAPLVAYPLARVIGTYREGHYR